jgi:hypothetical protein
VCVNSAILDGALDRRDTTERPLACGVDQNISDAELAFRTELA